MTDAIHPRYLEVRLYGEVCGYLCELAGNCRFVPSESFKAANGAPTLTLSMAIPGTPAIAADIFSNAFHPALYNTGGKLPPFFAGLLPESDLRKRLEATRHNPEDRDDFGVLAAAGETCQAQWLFGRPPTRTAFQSMRERSGPPAAPIISK